MDYKSTPTIDGLLKDLRENPEQYRAVRERFFAAGSDEDRVALLIDFATADPQLAAMMPEERGDEAALATTTVTVTTIIIWPDTAY